MAGEIQPVSTPIPPPNPTPSFGFMSQVVPSTSITPNTISPEGLSKTVSEAHSASSPAVQELGYAAGSGILQGYTFGANTSVYKALPPDIAKSMLDAAEKHPVLNTLSTLVGASLPGSTVSAGTKLIGGSLRTLSGLGKLFLSEGISPTAIEAAPGATKTLFKQGMESPSATAVAATTYGLMKSEGYSTEKSTLSALAGFGLQKITEAATGIGGKMISNLTRDDIVEIAKNPQLYGAMKDKTVSDLLRIPVETTEKILADARQGGSQQRLLIGRGQIQFVNNARKVLGNDFKQAATAEIQKLGNPAIDMTKPSMDLKTFITDDLGVPVGPRGEISAESIKDLADRGYDSEILRIYNRLFTKGSPATTTMSPVLNARGNPIATTTAETLPQPKMITLSELSKLKQLVANRTNFSSGDKFDRVNTKIYGLLNEATKEQAPTYYALTQKFSGGLRAIDDYKDVIIRGKTPADFITSLTGETPKTLDTKNDFIQRTQKLAKDVQFNDANIQTIYNEAIPQQISHIDAAIDMTAMQKKLPKAGGSLQFFMSQPLDALRNQTFVSYATSHPELKKVYDEVLKYKIMNRVFGILDDTIKQVEKTSAPNVVIGSAGAHMYETSKNLLGSMNISGNTALKHPNVILALDKLKSSYQALKADSNPWVSRILEASGFSPKSFAKNLPIIMRSPQQRDKLKQAITAGKNYSASIEQDLKLPGGTLGPIISPENSNAQPNKVMDLRNPNAQDIFTEEDPTGEAP